MFKNTALIAASILAIAPAFADHEPSDLAKQIAKETIITDGHIDVPYRLDRNWVDVGEATAGGDFDYPRAVQGGLNAPFMSIYTPADYEFDEENPLRAYEHANAMIDIVERMVSEHPDKFVITRTPAEVQAAFDKGLIALPLGLENGGPILGDMDKLQHFFDRGIRYITLAHSLSNHISDSSYDSERKHHGLSDFGVDVVKRMNELGIMVDLSHVSDGAFWEAIATSSAPMIASHSSPRHFTPNWERNMSDDMIKALAAKGGIIMINFGGSFVTKEALDWRNQFGKVTDAVVAAGLADPSDPEQRAAWNDAYKQAFPYPYPTLDDVLDQFDHVVEIAGIDAVGIGSDYDGVGDTLPVGLKDVSTYPNLIDGLLKRGYSREDIEKILSGNLMRVWNEVEKETGR